MSDVLLLGDSHTYGSYGKELERLFDAAGFTVTRVGWVGARADHYLKSTQDKIGLGGTGDWSTAKGKHYALAVVTLGTNDAAILPTGGSASSAASKIRELANGLDADVVWYVGPPAFEAGVSRTYAAAFKTDDLNARADRLWTATAPLFDRTIDSRAVTKPFVSSSDIHFGPKGGKAWAQAVFDTVSTGGGSTGLSTAGSSSSVGVVLALIALGSVAFLWFKRRRV